MKTTLPPLIKDDNSINDPTEKADALNQMFYTKAILNDIFKLILNLTQPNQTFNNIVFEVDEVRSVLKSRATGKISRPDLLNNPVLKELAGVMSTPLTDLFNTSLFTSVVPETWKQVNVTLIHKK